MLSQSGIPLPSYISVLLKIVEVTVFLMLNDLPKSRNLLCNFSYVNVVGCLILTDCRIVKYAFLDNKSFIKPKKYLNELN